MTPNIDYVSTLSCIADSQRQSTSLSPTNLLPPKSQKTHLSQFPQLCRPCKHASCSKWSRLHCVPVSRPFFYGLSDVAPTRDHLFRNFTHSLTYLLTLTVCNSCLPFVSMQFSLIVARRSSACSATLLRQVYISLVLAARWRPHYGDVQQTKPGSVV